MERYLKLDEWRIIEDGFDPDKQKASESIFSIGNGHMGQRANFEEEYSGETLQGSYIAGIYYPDKTRVGWWKNGYPEYFAKVLNSTNWIGIDIEINGQSLDLAKCQVSDFRRELNMREGYLDRSFRATMDNGEQVEVNVHRFLSITHPEIGLICYKMKALNFDGEIKLTPYINGEVYNMDANYDEIFWERVSEETNADGGIMTTRTKKSDFYLCSGMSVHCEKNGVPLEDSFPVKKKPMYIGQKISVNCSEGDEISLYKYAVNASSFDHEVNTLNDYAKKELSRAVKLGYDELFQRHTEKWKEKWELSDIRIEGDVAAQQGIRFNIFQLNQTYTGEDERLNIGPKGFTGEKYGGSTYWDTEAFCLPFYLNTADDQVARNLLLYRYKHLQKAIENAEKLGFSDGAALYPMVTMNGEECHNEWEITFEEIHRNGAIAYAIYNYIRHTGDREYLAPYGLEVLIGISRFWSQRVNFSEKRQKYVMLGVTGPNEYENNVNNNWYTNLMATWTMQYTQEAISYVKENYPETYKNVMEKTGFDDEKETDRWNTIIDNMYYPEDDERGIYLQQDGYLDKKQQLADELDSQERPINQHWSWDRILRSCFIKQGDVLQGIYFLEEQFDVDTIERNFRFYEPRTVHESSLSPCIHAILASKIRDEQKAYELYLRTARLDLDDYNQEVDEGCHITSMAGTWMSIVEGFAGKRVKDGKLHFNPFIPEQWDAYSFKILFRGNLLTIKVRKEDVTITCKNGNRVALVIYGNEYFLKEGEQITVGHEQVVKAK